MEEIIAEKTLQYGIEMEAHTQRGGPKPVTVVSPGNEDLGRIVKGLPTDPSEKRPFTHCFAPERVKKSWENLGAVPLTRKCLGHKKVRQEAGGCAPQAERLQDLQERHERNQAAARKRGLNVGNFTASVPVHTHIARESDSTARVRSLAATGAISTTSLWQTTGAVAVNSWQAFAAQDLITAKDMKESATKAAAKAAADLQVVTYVAKPEQPTVRSSVKGKREKVVFLSALDPSWDLLVADALVACHAAVAAANCAMEEADAAEAAAFTNNQPPPPPSVSHGAVTAAAVDVKNMTAAERRSLLAMLVDADP